MLRENRSDALRSSYRLHILNLQRQSVKIIKRDLQAGKAT